MPTLTCSECRREVPAAGVTIVGNVSGPPESPRVIRRPVCVDCGNKALERRYGGPHNIPKATPTRSHPKPDDGPMRFGKSRPAERRFARAK